jgi:hypothetical protein
MATQRVFTDEIAHRLRRAIGALHCRWRTGLSTLLKLMETRSASRIARTAGSLAGAAVITMGAAGCGPGASGATAAKVFTVCTAPVASCTGKAQRTKPTSIVLSADGAVYLSHLTWSAWGTGTATGRGIQEQNNCQPTCAAGKFFGYQATVTLSRPRAYGRNAEAYSALTMSAPSNPNSYWRHVTYTKRLVP